jgi:hypothetical protein
MDLLGLTFGLRCEGLPVHRHEAAGSGDRVGRLHLGLDRDEELPRNDAAAHILRNRPLIGRVGNIGALRGIGRWTHFVNPLEAPTGLSAAANVTSAASVGRKPDSAALGRADKSRV